MNHNFVGSKGVDVALDAHEAALANDTKGVSDVKLCADAYWEIMNAKVDITRQQQARARLALESKNLESLNAIKTELGIDHEKSP